jgi:uncharacterized oxidoreductase
MKLAGKRILITGGGSGIGLELARRLADANRVVIAGRDEAKLEQARARTPALDTLRLDVCSESEARGAIDWVARELGGLDLLVNNAGLLRGYPLGAADAEAKALEDIQVNVIGVVRMTRLALPLLERAPEPGLLFMSSAVALTAVPGYSVYAATKAAVHSLARSLRAELAGSRIRVFEVLPPVVDTGPVSALDVRKLPPGAVADAVIAGLRRDREEIRVARVRQLVPLARLMPRVADRIVMRSLNPRAGADARTS